MERTIVATIAAPLPVGPYNQAVVVDNTVYVAGQGPIDPSTGKLSLGSFEQQAELTFSNIAAILDAAGSGMRDVVKVTVYLADLADFAKLNDIYCRAFAEPYPARATVGVQLLFNTLIEVDCIAIRRSPLDQSVA